MELDKEKGTGGLVLTRRFEESIFIHHGGEILEFSVKKFQGNQVRVHFIGPKSFDIKRGEKILKEKK